MRSKISILVSILLIFSMVCGCAGQAESSIAEQAVAEAVADESTEQDASADSEAPAGKKLLELKESALGSVEVGNIYELEDGDQISFSSVRAGVVNGKTATPFTIRNADYVLIYNPYLFDQRTGETASQNTGDISSQISIPTNRADEMNLDVQVNTAPTGTFDFADIDFDEQNDGRASTLIESYDVGDKEDFFYSTTLQFNPRYKGEFTCLYKGEYCYVWNIGNNLSKENAAKFGQEFDNLVYPKATANFGKTRFVDDGGKLHILFFGFDNPNYLGFFNFFDVYTLDELGGLENAEQKGLNSNKEIVCMNITANVEFLRDLCPTLAHEYQHLLCQVATISNSNTIITMNTWLNEAMSAYAQEISYPSTGEKQSLNQTLYASNNYKRGQSLYNFSVAGDEVFFGAYGAVYFFEEYLRHYNGNDIFSKIHKYWRSKPGSELTEAKALSNSVTPEFKTEIDQSIQYPSQISSRFAEKDDEWMSKLTLNYYYRNTGNGYWRFNKISG